MAQQNYRPNKRSRLKLLGLLLGMALFLAFSIPTAARYVMNSSKTDQAVAKDFYFTSDLLTSGDTPVYQLANIVPGSSTIQFNLRNYIDDLRVAETAISYEVTTSVAGFTGETGTIAFSATLVNHPVTLTIPAAVFANGATTATVRVTATATSPYTQTLAAVFELHKKVDTIAYAVHDASGSNTAALTVTTNDYAGQITVTVPGALLPDRTDSHWPAITGDTTNGYTCQFTAVADAQYSFVFFKTDPAKTYSANLTGYTIAFAELTPSTP